MQTTKQRKCDRELPEDKEIMEASFISKGKEGTYFSSFSGVEILLHCLRLAMTPTVGQKAMKSGRLSISPTFCTGHWVVLGESFKLTETQLLYLQMELRITMVPAYRVSQDTEKIKRGHAHQALSDVTTTAIITIITQGNYKCPYERNIVPFFICSFFFSFIYSFTMHLLHARCPARGCKHEQATNTSFLYCINLYSPFPSYTCQTEREKQIWR